MEMMRRRMQLSNPILITILLLIPVIIVNGFNEEEKKEEEEKIMKVELVHRHDPRLAGDHDVNQLGKIKGFIARDFLRSQRINQRLGFRTHNKNRRKDLEFKLALHSGRDYEIGEYFVQVKVGTPAKKFWLAVDTGSEFTWFNCHVRYGGGGVVANKKGGNMTSIKPGGRTRVRRTNPCHRAFCPHYSRTFDHISCASRKCKVDLSELFSLAYCPKPSDPCLYDISYADGSSAKGFFGTDIITVDLTNGRKGKIHNLTIGCTRSMINGRTFNELTGGIFGLGFAKDSFVDKATLEFNAKFSYCLMDHLSHSNVSSFLTFGNHNAKLLSEIKKTELVLVPPFYGVNVVGISIGGQMMKIPPKVWDFNAQGGTIVDSGTTLTGLILQAYEPVFEALKSSLTKVKRVTGDLGVLDFCFESKGFDGSEVPRLVFHFAGGSRFEPPVKNYIIDVAPGVKCIGIIPINETVGTNVIGNIMQQNHLWEFDLNHNTVGFAPSACS